MNNILVFWHVDPTISLWYILQDELKGILRMLYSFILQSITLNCCAAGEENRDIVVGILEVFICWIDVFC